MKTQTEERTLATFNWKDQHLKCFFKHYKYHENIINKAGGKLKRYGCGMTRRKIAGKNRENFLPTMMDHV